MGCGRCGRLGSRRGSGAGLRCGRHNYDRRDGHHLRRLGSGQHNDSACAQQAEIGQSDDSKQDDLFVGHALLLEPFSHPCEGFKEARGERHSNLRKGEQA
jgi:hypothetical protein